MRKVLAIVLSLLLILPMFATIAFAADPFASADDVNSMATNIAGQATATVDGTGVTSSVQPDRIIDGDVTTGTKSPRDRLFSYFLTYESSQYFTDIVIACNGSGELANGEEVSSVEYNVKKLAVNFYNNDVLVHAVPAADVSQLTEYHVEVSVIADKIEIVVGDKEGENSPTYYIWEVGTYALVGIELCDVKMHNIAKEARFSYINGVTDNPNTATDESQAGMWWAVNWLALVDGNTETGTHSPKYGNYKFAMEFSSEHLISEIIFHCNGKGFLDDGSFATVKEYQFNNTQTRIRLYDLNGELVFDSKDIAISDLTAKVDPYVQASKIEFEMFNGQHGGGEYMWEIEVNGESGSHIFEEVGSKNPTCGTAGYKELKCHCNKLIKQTVPATGFHQWNEGVVTTEPTATTNGVRTKTCTICEQVGDFDIPATGHNWDGGTIVAPTCDTEGYTKYQCTDSGCTMEYVDNVVKALGHDWDDGVVTKEASLGVKGEMVVSCMRTGCGVTKVSPTRELTYFDNTKKFFLNSTTVELMNLGLDKASTDKEVPGFYNPDAATPLPTEETVWQMFDGSLTTYGYAPTGTETEFLLNDVYYFTAINGYASGNYCKFSMFFYTEDDDGNWVQTAQYDSPAIDNGNDTDSSSLVAVDLAKVIGNGIEASKIVIKYTATKWDNGSALKIHELNFYAHDCVVDEDDYNMDPTAPGYVAPTCTQDGQTTAECPVCLKTVNVTLEMGKYGHKVENVIADVEPTCSKDGVGHGTCVNPGCGVTVTDIAIKSTGLHDYTKEIKFMEEKCGFLGIKQIVCSGCGRVGSQEPIPAHGHHTHEWIVNYEPSYTAPGEKEWHCSVCGAYDESKGGVEVKEEIPVKEIDESFISFVGISVRATDFVGLRLTYDLNLEALQDEDLLYECDVRVITYITNKDGETKTIDTYGKFADPEEVKMTADGEFSVVLDPSSVYDEFTITTKVRLMNFRGVVYEECVVDLTNIDENENGMISVYEVAKYLVSSNANVPTDVKRLYNDIIAGKPNA